MNPHWCSLRRQRVSSSRGWEYHQQMRVYHSNLSQQCWLGRRVQTGSWMILLWRRWANSDRLRQALTLPLTESGSQIGSHLLFFILIVNNWGHQLTLLLLSRHWKMKRTKKKKKKRRRRWRQQGRRWSSRFFDGTSRGLLILGIKTNNEVGSRTTSNLSLLQCSLLVFLITFL